jgi:hypothetical protein
MLFPWFSLGHGHASGRPPVSFSLELDAAIGAAQIVVRSPDDEGPRVAIISQTLGGSFVYSRVEAKKRIATAFPEVDQAGVQRAALYLENRAVIACAPPEDVAKHGSWVEKWRHEAR